MTSLKVSIGCFSISANAGYMQALLDGVAAGFSDTFNSASQ
jgi:hypothetical protein